MENIDWISVITSILSGLLVCIPLAAKLVKYVQKAVQEKNWAALLDLLIDLMEEAELKFEDGATRKEWVMAMVQTSSEYLNYPVDTQALSTMIDTLCDMSKVLNTTTTASEDSEASNSDATAA